MAESTDKQSRRGWILQGLKVGIAATVVAIFYPVVWFLRPRKATVSGALEITAPFTVNELPAAEGNPFNFAGKPCLIVLSSEGARRLVQGKRLRPDDVRAFNAICTHVDCTVRYRSEQGDIFCSCHDGIYDLRGRNVSGPPPRPLESYKVVLRGEPGREEILISRES
jgi:cytochrome b6-f complex iron-sulfur subunit